MEPAATHRSRDTRAERGGFGRFGPPHTRETLHQIGHSLCCVLFGYSGAAVAGRLVGPKRGRG